MTVLMKRPAHDGTPVTTYPMGPLHAITLAEAVQEFVVRYGGEWRVIPMEPVKAPTTTAVSFGSDGISGWDHIPPTGRPRIAGFWPVNTLWGNYGPEAHQVFEFGVPRGNVASYTFNVDRQQVANNVLVPRVGWPEPGRVGTTAAAVATSAESKTAMGMRYDAWVDPGEIQLTAQRQFLADNHRNLRAGPRRIINFTPVVNAELQPWVDYDVGDFVRFRAFNGTQLRYDLVVRIYNITANLDAQGNESITVSTSQEATPTA